jgi:Flp pilus assembly protein TadG
MALVLGFLMFGFMALAVDMGHLFAVKRQAQAAADAAALAAASEINQNTSYTTATAAVQNAANVAAAQNGFSGVTPVLSQASSGNYPNSGAAVPQTWITATVSAPIQTYFLSAFKKASTPLTVGASATAAAGAPSSTCICLTGGTGTDLNMSNDADLNSVGCGITVNSSSSNAITVVGSASVCGTTVAAVANPWGGSTYINNAGTICPAAKQVKGAAACSSPIVAPVKPSGLTSCANNPVKGYALNPGWNGNYSLPFNGAAWAPGGAGNLIPNDMVVNSSVCYTGFNMSGAASVNFGSGITYFINGDFTTGGGETITGTNVAFVISGNLNIANGTTMNLTAPNAADGNPGVLFYLPNSTSTVSIQGGSNSNFSGILWAPNSDVNIANGTGTSTKADFVAKTLTMAGGATLNDYATTLIGGAGGGAGKAELVQ